ncbi:MAG: SurA N-terminal domain-containing protein [Hyphomicrobiales bacterium]|nr:SurA N-terminal domain-containing protein [Hyphomicrobiales bacterium]MDE2115037.1 SurA N-terminal domain-containing protein [Hyphomicrobiales bacterium]
MLKDMRAANESWMGRVAAAILMGLIVVSFSAFGINKFLTDLTTTTLAHVGSQTVSLEEFRTAYNAQLQRLTTQTHRQVTNQEAHALGVDTGLLNQMVSQKALDQKIAKLGLDASDKLVRDKVFADPSFAGPSGKFDAARLQQYLQDNRISEADYIFQQRQRIVTQQLIDSISADIVAPKAYLSVLNRVHNETRSIDFFTLDPKAAGTIPAPTPEQLQSFFAPRAGAYQAPEYRSIVMLDVEPGVLAKSVAISDADAQKRYDAVKATAYTQPERRDIQQITFPTEAEAAAALAKLKGGMSFDDLAKERKLAPKDYDLGTVTKGTLFADTDAAAFTLPENGTSEPVKNLVGFALVHVAKVFPATVTPFAEVAAKLKSGMAADKARQDADALRDKIEDARTNGKDLKAAAASVGLTANEIPAVDVRGLDKDGKPVAGLSANDPLLHAAFDTAVGVDNETIRTKSGGTEWFELKSIEPARQRTLAELHDQIVSAWTTNEVNTALKAKAEDMVKKLNGGAKLEDVAKAAGDYPVSHVSDVQRQGTKDVADVVAAQVFNVHVGAAGSADVGPQGRVIFKVLDAIVPVLDVKSKEAEATASQLARLLASDIANEYVAKVKKDVGVSVDEALFRQATGNSTP